MSNPNTSTLPSTASNSSMRTIHIGKNSQPITLTKVASVNSYSWRKSTSYNTFENSVYSLLGLIKMKLRLMASVDGRDKQPGVLIPYLLLFG